MSYVVTYNFRDHQTFIMMIRMGKTKWVDCYIWDI
jgi:hypothetical protein